MGFFEFLQNNFFHVLPIFLAAGFAAAIVMERFKKLFQEYPMRNPDKFMESISRSVLTGNTAEALSICDQHKKKPLAQVAKEALVRAHLPESMIHHGIEYSLGKMTAAIRKRTAFLATIANVATLLGLFGTILGLVHSFEAVGHADAQQKSALLAAGIATSMNATMLGLGVAIPCMVAFSFLMNRANQLTTELETSSVRLLEILKQRFYGFEEDAPQERTSAPQPATSERGAA